MATSPEAVRRQLAVVSAAATAEIASAVNEAPPAEQVAVALAVMPLVVPSYYDAAGSLAVAWYDDIRVEADAVTSYSPRIIGDPETDWIEREVEKLSRQMVGDLDVAADAAVEAQRLLDEALALAEKEVARGFRDSITGNVRMDEDAIGWSRVARPGACKLCLMIAGRGAVFKESTATFATHTSCHCAARPEFRNGEHGPEATVEQYLAASKRRTPAQRKALRKYLNENFPGSPG